ncbi:MAG: AraC family transcriptional regulator [Alistipes sp.]|nr:AraC family transcriptional regulator [Alistipes sp.]
MVQYYEWIPFFENIKGVYSIDNQLAMFTYSEVVSQLKQRDFDYLEAMRRPHKFDFFLFVNHTSGGVKFKLDMEEYEVETGGNIITFTPGQIISVESFTPDFDADVMILSSQFMESLLVYLKGTIPMRFGMMRQVVFKNDEQEMQMQEVFVKAVKHVLKQTDNPFRLQMVQHVMMAIFYASDKPQSISNKGDVIRTNADLLTKQFLELVKVNFRKERQLKFYADELCITPRYLSRVVKECSGSSASDWIERYVVLEARALLKSTNMNIQQISDSLNFPSQTFFGKYFKRRVGMSPKEYRRVG